MLMGHRLGLGTFFTGFALAPVQRGLLLYDLLDLDHGQGISTAPTFIALALEAARAQTLSKRTAFLAADLNQLPFEDCAFD